VAPGTRTSHRLHAASTSVPRAHTSGPRRPQAGDHGCGRHGRAPCKESCEGVAFLYSGMPSRLARRQDRAGPLRPRRPNHPSSSASMVVQLPTMHRPAREELSGVPGAAATVRSPRRCARKDRTTSARTRTAGHTAEGRAGSPSQTGIPPFRHFTGDPSSFPPTSTYAHGARSTDCRPGSTTRP
jgi:hypothetical protein